MVAEVVRHPAKYTKDFIPVFAEILNRYGCTRVLDPMAGVGRIAEVRDHGYTGKLYANELEPEWAWQAAGSVNWIGTEDAADMPFKDSSFDGECTSSTYGNRMGDHHNARDASRRNTYTHAIGRQLRKGNTGAMQFGLTRRTALRYCVKHKAIWIEQDRVLCDGGILILNISDHIRKGRRVRVTLWHILCLKSLGFELIERHDIPTPRLKYGANGDKRVDHESILVFRLHKSTSGEGRV